MKLPDLYVQCLFTAAASREMIKREWLLDALTVMSDYSYNLSTTAKPEVGHVLQLPGADPVAKKGQVVCINKTHIGVVLDDEAMSLTIGVLSQVGQPPFDKNDEFHFDNSIARKYFGDVELVKSNIPDPTYVGRFIENMIVLQYPTN